MAHGDPGDGGAMAQPAIADNVVELFRRDAGRREHTAKLFRRLERIVRVEQFLEIEVHGAGDAPGPLGTVINLEGIIGDTLAGIFLWRTQVDEQPPWLAPMIIGAVASPGSSDPLGPHFGLSEHWPMPGDPDFDLS